MSQTALNPNANKINAAPVGVKPAIWLLATGNAHKATELQTGLQASGWPITIKIPPAALLEGLEENGTTFIENATLKASYLLAYAQEINADAVLGDDSGLRVDALEGYLGLSPFPGLHSNRWLTPERKAALLGGELSDTVSNHDKCLAILHLLKGKPAAERQGAFICALALLPVLPLPVTSAEKTPWLSAPLSLQKELAIDIIEEAEPRGSNGFGYDVIALPRSLESALPPPLETTQALTQTSRQTIRRTVAELPEAFKQKHSHRALALEALLQELAKQWTSPAVTAVT